MTALGNFPAVNPLTVAGDVPVSLVDLSGNQTGIATNPLRIAAASVASSTGAPTRFADLGSNATANVKATPGNVFGLYCNNGNVSDRYLHLHNTATTPSAAAVPLYTFRVPAGGDIVIGTDFFTQTGAYFSVGIAFAFSTTKNTYTAGTASDQSTLVHYA